MWRSVPGAIALATLAGCSLLTSFGGYSDGESGPVDASLAGDADVSGDAGPSSPTRERFLFLGGGSDESFARLSTTFAARIGEEGSLGPWKEGAPLPRELERGAAVAAGGKIVVIAGIADGGAVSGTYVGSFGDDIVTSWASGPPLPVARGRHGAILNGDRIFVFGGTDSLVPTNTTYVARFENGGFSAWSPGIPMPGILSSMVLGTSGDRIYLVSGEIDNTPSEVTPSDVAWIADVGASGLSSFRTTTKLPRTTSSAAGTATATHVYVHGGYGNQQNDSVLAAPIQPDGSLGSWSVAGRLEFLAFHSMVVAGRHLYVLGGRGDGGYRSNVWSAEIRADGTLSDFTLRGTLPTERQFFYVAVLER